MHFTRCIFLYKNSIHCLPFFFFLFSSLSPHHCFLPHCPHFQSKRFIGFRSSYFIPPSFIAPFNGYYTNTNIEPKTLKSPRIKLFNVSFESIFIWFVTTISNCPIILDLEWIRLSIEFSIECEEGSFGQQTHFSSPLFHFSSCRCLYGGMVFLTDFDC